MSKKKIREANILRVSAKECQMIFDALDLYAIEILEFDVYAPGKIISCTKSAVAKLKNYDFSYEPDGDEDFPLTLNEFVAANFALNYFIRSFDDGEYSAEDLEEDVAPVDNLRALSKKLNEYLLACNIIFE